MYCTMMVWDKYMYNPIRDYNIQQRQLRWHLTKSKKIQRTLHNTRIQQRQCTIILAYLGLNSIVCHSFLLVMYFIHHIIAFIWGTL